MNRIKERDMLTKSPSSLLQIFNFDYCITHFLIKSFRAVERAANLTKSV